MTKMSDHQIIVDENLSKVIDDQVYFKTNQAYLEFMLDKNFHYNFSWLGRPIIQMPQDIYAVQEMIWDTKPDLIIETGIAHGGSVVLAASMMAQLDMMDALSDPALSDDPSEIMVARKRHVIGIDIDIRSHNKTAMQAHPLSAYWQLIEGSSVDKDIVAKVSSSIKHHQKVMVMLDSNHTHDHVLQELKAYAPFVSKDCYLVVWDAGLEDLSDTANKMVEQSRPWGKGNNPKTALIEYLKLIENDELTFQIDRSLRAKIGISATSDSFLRRVK